MGLCMSEHEEDSELFHSMINRVLDKEVAPFYDQWEEQFAIPRNLWNTLGQAGMLGIDMPEEYGGAQASFEIGSWPLRKWPAKVSLAWLAAITFTPTL